MGGSAYGQPAEVEGTFIWVCLIGMLGSMEEQRASLQSPPIQTQSLGHPLAGAHHPISHTGLKPPPSPTPSQTSLKHMQTGKQTPNGHHRHTVHTHTDNKTHKIPIDHCPLLYKWSHAVLGRWERGQHTRRVPDDPLIPPWTIGSHSVVSSWGLVMCHSWLFCYWTTMRLLCNVTVYNSQTNKHDKVFRSRFQNL